MSSKHASSAPQMARSTSWDIFPVNQPIIMRDAKFLRLMLASAKPSPCPTAEATRKRQEVETSSVVVID